VNSSVGTQDYLKYKYEQKIPGWNFRSDRNGRTEIRSIAGKSSAVFVLRRKMPDASRPYKTLGYPVTPIIFILVRIWLLINTLQTSPLEAAVGLFLIALGLPVYFYFRSKT